MNRFVRIDAGKPRLTSVTNTVEGASSATGAAAGVPVAVEPVDPTDDCNTTARGRKVHHNVDAA